MRGNERGQTLPLICLFMFSLIGMCALVIDLGGAFVAKRQTQAAADAAALAGVSQLQGNWSGAASGMFAKNTLHIAGASETAALTTDLSANDSVTVTVSYDQPTYFAKLFGYQSIHITATARATAQSVVAGNAAPFALFASCNPTVGAVIPIYGGTTPCGQNTSSNVGTIVEPAAGVSAPPSLTCKANGSPAYNTVPAGNVQNVIDGSTPTGTLSVGDCVQTQTGKNPLSIKAGTYLVPIVDDTQQQGHQGDFTVKAFEWVTVTADEQGKVLTATVVGLNDSPPAGITTGKFIPGYLNYLGLTQ